MRDGSKYRLCCRAGGIRGSAFPASPRRRVPRRIWNCGAADWARRGRREPGRWGRNGRRRAAPPARERGRAGAAAAARDRPARPRSPQRGRQPALNRNQAWRLPYVSARGLRSHCQLRSPSSITQLTTYRVRFSVSLGVR